MYVKVSNFLHDLHMSFVQNRPLRNAYFSLKEREKKKSTILKNLFSSSLCMPISHHFHVKRGQEKERRQNPTSSQTQRIIIHTRAKKELLLPRRCCGRRHLNVFKMAIYLHFYE